MSSAAVDSSPPGEFYCPICEQAFAFGGACPTDGNKLIRLDAVDPFLGRELDGKYTILEKLGQGGMGAVYRADHRWLRREAAVKVITGQRVTDPDVIKRFLREAKLASRLSHPNAVAVTDFGQTDDGVCYLVMELVRGRTLDDVLAAEGVFPPDRLVRVAAQICDALERAHELQIVHRDLKPTNVMLLDQEHDLVKILDFGLATSVASGDQTRMTITGALLGTPAYMSPELALGLPCDGRADLYSLGVVLYQLGSGRLPFQSSSAHELISLHGTELAPAMTGVPRALARVIDRLLRKDPADRYPTAAAAREALEHALADRDASGAEPPGASPARSGALAAAEGSPEARAVATSSLHPTMPRIVRRRRWLAPVIAGSLAAAAAAAGVAGYLVLGGDSPPPSPPSPAVITPAPPDPPPPPVASDTALEPAAPLEAAAPPATKPAKPARPPKMTRLRPKPARPATPPEPKPAKPAKPETPPEPRPAGSGSARPGGLPF